MKTLMLSVLFAFGLAVSVSAQDKGKDPKPEPKPAKVKVEGKTSCGHCDLDIDEGGGCNLAVQDKDGFIYILQGDGDLFKEINKGRKNKLEVKFEGEKIGEKKTGEGIKYSIIKVTRIEDKNRKNTD